VQVDIGKQRRDHRSDQGRRSGARLIRISARAATGGALTNERNYPHSRLARPVRARHFRKSPAVLLRLWSGVPTFVSDHCPSSHTPAFSHFLISRSVLGSAIFLCDSLIHYSTPVFTSAPGGTA
jgi:hypothetical protein